MKIDLRSMDGHMTSTGEACPLRKAARMIRITDEGEIHLDMTGQAEIFVRLNKHLLINGTVNLMTEGAAFPHRRMLIHKGALLVQMTPGA